MSALKQLPLAAPHPAAPADQENLFPQAWYMLCRSRDIPIGAVRSHTLVGLPIVLFRTSTGTLHAVDAHCAHMGTHLGSGSVVNDCLRCPLHHWMFEPDGHCRGRDAAQRTWPVVERFGAVFVFLGPRPLFDVPHFAAGSDLCTLIGRTVSINCPWLAITSNGFDMQHLHAVHERALREPPQVEALDPFRLQLRYVSRVTGHGLPDRTMKWLSGDHIRVAITSWGGTIFTVESQVGRHTSMLLLSLMPAGDNTVNITPLFARRRSGFAPVNYLGIRLAGWLFLRFLVKDVAMMRNMRFQRPLGLSPDEPMQRFLDYVDHLPKLSGGFQRERDASCH